MVEKLRSRFFLKFFSTYWVLMHFLRAKVFRITPFMIGQNAYIFIFASEYFYIIKKLLFEENGVTFQCYQSHIRWLWVIYVDMYNVYRNKCLLKLQTFFQTIVYCATITGTTKTGDHILRKNSFIFWVLFPSKHVHYDNF